MALPQGALEQLLDGGTAAFDAAIQADRDATQKMFDDAKTRAEEAGPVLAKNNYNQTKLDAASKPMTKPADPDDVAGASQHPRFTLDIADATDTPVEDLRARVGVDVVRKLPAQAREVWNTEDEAAALSFFMQEGVPSRVIEQAMLHYADAIMLGEPLDQAVKRFHQEFSTTLTKRQRDALVSFVQEIHGAQESTE